jgi:hypothetical protein
MPEYFVRTSGNDGYDGLTPATAFATPARAAQLAAAGDVVWIGGGVYHDTQMAPASGANGSPIQFRGDLNGAKTGDPGVAILTNYLANHTSNNGQAALDLNTRCFVEFYDLVFHGYRTQGVAYIHSTTAYAFEGVTFDGCVLLNENGGNPVIQLEVAGGATPAGDGLTLRNCLLHTCLRLAWTVNAARPNLKLLIENCLFVGRLGATAGGVGVYLSRSGTGSGSIGGITIRGCTFLANENAVYAAYIDNASNPIRVVNCKGIGVNRLVSALSATAGSVYEDYNLATADNTALTEGVVTAGGHSRNQQVGLLLGGIIDFPLYRRFGWSGLLPWQPLVIPEFDRSVDAGSEADLPATDAYGNPRRAYRGYDIGAIEGRVEPVQDTALSPSGAAALRFDGASWHDVLIASDAAPTTISVWARYDSAYTGTLPTLEVKNIPSVADQTAAMVGGSETWEQITLTFTPTAAGVCRVRLRSQDTSALGRCWFDDLTW